MRAAPLLVLLLLAVPPADGTWSYLRYREIEGPGWWAESFQLINSTRIWVAFDVVSSGELTGHMVALYADNGTLLRGTTYFSEGGQQVEATLVNGDVRVTNEGVNETAQSGPFAAEVRWTCDAACNPSRKFKLVITAGGDLEGWRYAVLTEGAARIANASGTDAWAYTTRQFDGDVVHVGTPVRGVHIASDVTLQAHADDRMLTTFVKPGPTPQVMRVEGAVDAACPCYGGDWTSGDYAFRYSDRDTNGIEGYLTFADVRLP